MEIKANVTGASTYRELTQRPDAAGAEAAATRQAAQGTETLAPASAQSDDGVSESARARIADQNRSAAASVLSDSAAAVALAGEVSAAYRAHPDQGMAAHGGGLSGSTVASLLR